MDPSLINPPIHPPYRRRQPVPSVLRLTPGRRGIPDLVRVGTGVLGGPVDRRDRGRVPH